MSELLWCHYNNYYNRIIKREDSLAAYQSYAVRELVSNANFFMNDGVETKHALNRGGDTPDYLVVADDYGNITSRWFVLEAIAIRGGYQLDCTLRRDLVADFYDDFISAPAFIEKATISNKSALLMNKENMIFNQIKQAETLLKDETASAWIVGYVPKDAFDTNTTITAPVYDSDNIYEAFDDIEEFPYYTDNEWNIPDVDNSLFVRMEYCIQFFVFEQKYDTYQQDYFVHDILSDREEISNNLPGVTNKPYYLTGWESPFQPIRENSSWQNTIFNNLKDVVEADYTTTLDDVPLELNGKIIKDNNTGILYKIVITEEGPNTITYDLDPATIGLLRSYVRPLDGGSWQSDTFVGGVNMRTFRLSLQVFQANFTFTLGPTRNKLIDAPYDMFVMPYTDGLLQYKNGVEYFLSNKDISIAVATGISATLGSANVYDIQLLPYCPLRDYIKEDGTFDFGSAPYNAVYDENNNEVAGIFWATMSRFSLYIRESIVLDDLSALGLKVSNETDLYRIADPSQSAFFDFSVAKNGGTVDFFEVDCDYKPYTPYIHVAPSFSWLYSRDFDDVRGLICGGDFSLPQLTSAWAEYQMNNKNFQLQFDREVQSLDLHQNVGRSRDVLGIIAGAVGGLAGGAIGAGYATGKNASTMAAKSIVGAGVGVATGLVGGIANFAMNEALRKDEMSLKQDQFQYQLGNIQAIPYGLTKVSAFNQNNKIWPFIEKYTASDVEVDALKNKLKYNGMTVNVIGTPGDYLVPTDKNYIKGRLIRLPDIGDDYHVAAELNNEFEKGVFI